MECKYCHNQLTTDNELDFGICEEHLEISANRNIARQDWYTWHDEPCPEAELPTLVREK